MHTLKKASRESVAQYNHTLQRMQAALDNLKAVRERAKGNQSLVDDLNGRLQVSLKSLELLASELDWIMAQHG